MDIQQALSVADSRLWLRGTSDVKLADHVSSLGEPMELATALHGGASLRPADVLLRLAQATRARFQPDIFGIQSHWALMRYLGIFEPSAASPAGFALSSSGVSVVGNQRRVMSEELGIGFSVALAEEWQRGRDPRSGTPRVVDIDVALGEGQISANGANHSVASVRKQRPDYLLIADRPGAGPGGLRIELLESKGTKTKGHSPNQLIAASRQLRGIEVNGVSPRGLAVSTVISQGSVHFNALQTPTRTRSDRSALVAPASADVPESEEPDTVDVDVEELARPIVYEMDRGDSNRSRDLVTAAVQSSWAMLGDFAGNEQAFEHWAPSALRRNLARASPRRRTRTGREAVAGRPSRGTINTIALPGGQLEMFLGVDAEIDEALSSGDPERILTAQRGFSQRRFGQTQWNDSSDGQDRVHAARDDGAVMLLRAL
jgi:hypothetical protein